MRGERRRVAGRWLAGLVPALGLIAALAGCTGGTAAPRPTSPTSRAVSSSPSPSPSPSVPTALRGVRSMAVIGDSISVGYDACGALGPCERVNWATGSDPVVRSVAIRLGGPSPVAVHDLAVPGALMAGTAAQAARLTAPVDLVVVLAGANDLCTGSVSSMTAADAFALSLRRLLGEVDSKAPRAAVLVLSVPDVVVLSRVEGVPAAVAQDRVAFGACGTVLGDRAHGVTDADLAAVTQREAAYDAAIHRVCAARTRCIDDGGALTAERFTADEISTVDYFHPSEAGQRDIASIAWAALLRGRS